VSPSYAIIVLRLSALLFVVTTGVVLCQIQYRSAVNEHWPPLVCGEHYTYQLLKASASFDATLYVSLSLCVQLPLCKRSDAYHRVAT
jgi:hypothetical protein